MAITWRSRVNTMMGGDQAFKSMKKQAEKLQMKIILDSVSRVSSSRPLKVYRDKMLKISDEGKIEIFYGTYGRSKEFEDTSLLNYRRKDVWDLHITEVLELIERYKIEGIHLENGQSVPCIMRLDLSELYHRDCDGTPAYSAQEIFEGEVVLNDMDCGYWSSNAKKRFPNPFLVRFCKAIWQKFPHFMIISEDWNSFGTYDRQINLIKSGTIPRVYDLPIAISSIMGQHLQQDGSVIESDSMSVNVFKSWYEFTNRYRPSNSIVL